MTARTAGVDALISIVRMGDQDFDDAVAMTFAVAEVAYAYLGEQYDGFGPAPSHIAGAPDSIAGEREQYPDGMVIDYYESGLVTGDDLRHVYTVLTRYCDWLRTHRKDH